MDSPPKTIGFGALAGLLLVFAVAVLAVSVSVRNDTHRQLLDVDSNVLNLLVQNQIERAEQDVGTVYGFEALGEIEIWSALLETATAEGVFAVQLFDKAGTLRQSSSSALIESTLPREVTEALAPGRPRTYYEPQVWLSDFMEIGYERDQQVDVLDIYLPLFDGAGAERMGTARYLMDGSVLSREFSVLDARIARQAMVALGLGGFAMTALFWLAWRRLSEANRQAVQQAKRLGRANAELAALARTSAVGSVTAHLIHGLKNPLAGLRQVVGARRTERASIDDEKWEGAREAADRMQRLVEEVIGVLQDASSGLSYRMTSGEVLQQLQERFAEDAAKRSVSYRVTGDPDIELESSVSNIVSLIAGNLIRNALEAVPPGGSVETELAVDEDGRRCRLRVADTGVGVPPEMQERLFTPLSSSKSGGAGIGLSISSQLARHLGGELRHLQEAGAGAVFELCFPLGRPEDDGGG